MLEIYPTATSKVIVWYHAEDCIVVHAKLANSNRLHDVAAQGNSPTLSQLGNSLEDDPDTCVFGDSGTINYSIDVDR